MNNDHRKALPCNKGFQLTITDEDTGNWYDACIGQELARGGSCIVYRGWMLNKAVNNKAIIIKEFYPKKLENSIIREDDYKFKIEDRKNQVVFDMMLKNFREGQNQHVIFANENPEYALPSVFHIGKALETFYALSDLADGETLSAEKKDKYTIADALRLTVSICSAVEKVHQQYKVYLDLKPSNVFVNQSEDGEEPYEDSYGRTHYPIPLNDPIYFSDFLYFEFDAEGSDFLAERVGNGHIKELIVTVDTFTEESMLVLKNGDAYYSCLTNGWVISDGGEGQACYQFSSHKTFEGFEIVKDFNNKREVLCYFDSSDNESITTINVEGKTFNIDPESIYYDNATVVSTIGEIRQLFGLNPEFEVINNYGGPDQLVYDALVPETANFALDEFEGTFSVNEDKLYLDENELIELNGATKIYAAEINKDYHRDLVFESVVESERMFNIYDVFHNKYLYQKPVSEIGQYDYYLDMRDNRLVVNLFDNDELLDYGYFGYHFDNDGINIAWQNLF